MAVYTRPRGNAASEVGSAVKRVVTEEETTDPRLWSIVIRLMALRARLKNLARYSDASVSKLNVYVDGERLPA